MRGKRFQRRRGSDVDLTPMIDVVLQLIIFFMVTSQFTQLVRSELDLPEQRGEAADRVRPALVVIDMQADGTLLVEQQPIALEEIGLRLATDLAQAADAVTARVLIRAHRDAPTGAIDRLVNELGALGVRRVRFATTPVGGGGA